MILLTECLKCSNFGGFLGNIQILIRAVQQQNKYLSLHVPLKVGQ